MVADLLGEPSLLVALIRLVDRIPLLPAPPQPGRGRPRVYPDRLFLKALAIMIVKQLPRVGTLLAVLEEPTPEMRRLRALLTDAGRFPCRRTWERRLQTIPDTLPAQIGSLGRHLVLVLAPWAPVGRAAAIDSTALVATRRYVLGAVLVYQLVLLYRFETGRPLRTGLKRCLLAG